MNLTIVSRRPGLFQSPRLGRGRGAFALVVTLLILSLLLIVSVSYLSSMTAEHQTADAYAASVSAEQAARTGVDSATAMLAECFRDYPDSATVWDTQQTTNTGSSPNSAVVNTPNNQGTTLFLRAVPTTTSSGVTVANPLPHGSLTANGTPYAANDPAGNNPSNPACETFVLPLISGVPNGQPRLATEKGKIWPNTDSNPDSALNYMYLGESNPAKQNWTDLNVRRTSGDLQGVIGSPPGWATPATGTAPVGPQPARAYWVYLYGKNATTGNNDVVVGRYAFWIDDESFRLNVNKAGNAAARIDNGSATAKYPLDPTTSQPYSIRPADLCLYGPDVATSQSGPLSSFDAASGSSDAQAIINTRGVYPGGFFPDPLAFLHSLTDPAGASGFTSTLSDSLRYLTTTQSGTLNLSRHGTQRLNLNTTISTVDYSQPAAATTIQHQVDQLVQTMKFLLPNFGQRFYRLTSATDAGTLNALTVGATPSIPDPASIYYYKVAANIRDYLDGDCQPTIIKKDGSDAYPVVMPIAAPTGPAASDPGVNRLWAQGKEAAPFLQETVVRFQPTVNASTGAYSLTVDYYLEFWNMSDRDIYAAPQPASPLLPNLRGAYVMITNQQYWQNYNSNTAVTQFDITPGPLNWQTGNSAQPTLPLRSPYTDYNLDLTNGVYLNGVAQNGSGTPLGVVFRAGAATVITTDPQYQSYIEHGSSYSSDTGKSNPATTYYCTGLSGSGRRVYTGSYPRSAGSPNPDPSHSGQGIEPYFRDVDQDYETEITLANPYGYIDSVPYAVAEGGGPPPTTPSTGNTDYAFGGSLRGNNSLSTTGDPRSNNEQMVLTPFVSGGNTDQSRYYNGYHTLGYPNTEYVRPDAPSSGYVQWVDYWIYPSEGAGQFFTTLVNPDQTTSPAVVADTPLASIGQLGDVFDPARLTLTATPKSAEDSRGGGRTFKIGQRDDRSTYDSTGSPNGNNTLNNVPASQSWAAWRLTDIFSAGPVAPPSPGLPVTPASAYGSTQEPLELPGRININGVLRDNGLALSSLLAGFNFQPQTSADPLFHTPPNLASLALQTKAGSSYGFAKILAQMQARLNPALLVNGARSATPVGPFFERGEFGELEISGSNSPIFGKYSANAFVKSTDLVSSGVDLDHTFDRGREEVFRRLAEMICTRGDTFTVYVVGQSLLQTKATATPKINGTQRMRVTFRLVPKANNTTFSPTGDFHPAYYTNADGTISKGNDFQPIDLTTGATYPAVPVRFAKPDRYEIQVLSANTY